MNNIKINFNFFLLINKMSLLLDIYDIQFELRKSNSISLYYYITKYKFNDIIKLLTLKKENLSKLNKKTNLKIIFLLFG